MMIIFHGFGKSCAVLAMTVFDTAQVGKWATNGCFGFRNISCILSIGVLDHNTVVEITLQCKIYEHLELLRPNPTDPEDTISVGNCDMTVAIQGPALDGVNTCSSQV